MKSEQINELAVALAKAQSQIKHAIKDADNPFFKSKYADLTSVWDACRDALNKNGLSIVQTLNCGSTTFNHENRTVVEANVLITTLLHTSGQWIEGKCPLLNTKGDMQGLGSAISYARRYGIAAIIGVTTEDDDANDASQPQKFEDTTTNRPCTEKQAGMITAKLIANGLRGEEASGILRAFGSIYPNQIPFSKVNDVLHAIELHMKTKNPEINNGPSRDPQIQWKK